MKILLPFDVFLRTWCQRIISLPDTAQEVCRVSHKDAPLARLYIFYGRFLALFTREPCFFPYWVLTRSPTLCQKAMAMYILR